MNLSLFTHLPMAMAVWDGFGKDMRTIGRAITKLQQLNKLKRIGSAKTGHWEVLG